MGSFRVFGKEPEAAVEIDDMGYRRNGAAEHYQGGTMELLLVSGLGCLIGSIPFAYVIGKLFYRTDVRQHGSGNLGGSNTGRVLGKKAGIQCFFMLRQAPLLRGSFSRPR